MRVFRIKNIWTDEIILSEYTFNSYEDAERAVIRRFRLKELGFELWHEFEIFEERPEHD